MYSTVHCYIYNYGERTTLNIYITCMICDLSNQALCILYCALLHINYTVIHVYYITYLYSSLRVLSHLPHLVRLNRTRVGSLLVRFVWAGEHQKRTKQVFKRTLERFVCGENAIRPQTDPTAKRTAHFWTKPTAIVNCAVHYRMRKCLLTV